jgi:hypothetical protein
VADNYDPLSSQSVVELISPTETAEREQVTARAKPSGVVYSVRFPPALFTPEAVNDLLSVQADFYNRLAAHPYVVGIAELQDIGVNNEIVDKLLVTISSTNGEFTTQRDDLPWTLGEPQLYAAIDEVHEQLDAIAGL